MTQRLNPAWAVCALTVVLVLPAPPAPAGQVSQATQYFAVHGATLSEIDRSLSKSGPMVSDTGQRHPGATSVRFDGHVGYARVPRGCAVAETDIKLQLKTTLPKWRRPPRTEARTSLVWQTLAADIHRHEKQHSAIAISYMKRLESALKNLRPEPTCRQMEAKANRVMSRYLAEHERAQREFDTIEGREVDLRLNLALKRRLDSGQR
ncbi:DUF922 domain-containing protein [Fulvimarina sp. 2208YS6-2-32]|uniref:DUF922 domain-containing protein n=1 Tax=Fulvimarina uroteuthidis TaxID=3098149 RepID=A0ABU5I4H9_9HYPH|nr:DUF922 domain-containing protein [Fulvimarina sp. 2208YS6-2-32]MDY8110297.1 DUF922 domain-containing protein [Fulvimarina sp. 2208YS6-2-32]